ncbi:UNVERIFIED_CONTAM: hypothetical protein RMT77_010953 [Armadillidium vulgare]
MSREEVPFVLHGPTPITLEGGSQPAKVGCQALIITFKQTTQVGEISFRNYYTWGVSVHVLRCRNKQTGGEPEVNWRDPSAWQVALAQKIIMPHPHTEAGSHDHVSITCLESAVEWQDVAAMRLILRQPSPAWNSFGIEHLTVYRELPRLPPYSVPMKQGKSHQLEMSTLDKLILQTNKALSKDSTGTEDNLPLKGYEISTLQYS